MDDTGEILHEFVVETQEGLDQLDRDLLVLERETADAAVIAQIFRTMHTIKGSSGFLALPKLGGLAHHAENLLALLRDGRAGATQEVLDALFATADAIRSLLAHVERDGSEGPEVHADLLATLARLAEATPTDRPPTTEGDGRAAAVALEEAERAPSPTGTGPTSLRVDVGLLDTLMNLVGELVLARNRILQVAGSLCNADLLGTCQRLNLVTTELQEGVMKTRMQPIGSVWTKFPRLVRDVASACGRRVRLQMEGHATELDKTLLESVKDPLVHAIRNAIDHGIEPPEQRIAAGKPAEGLLRLRAFHEGGQVNIEVADDGRGIDPAKVRAKAVAMGLLPAERSASATDRDVLQFLMLPGFSTAERVTSVSGRGVGMDVVKTNIERIGGTIELQSTLGQGTTLRIKIPLTLAIIPALIVGSAAERFAIPQVNLLELVRLDAAANTIERIHGTPVYRLRGNLLPLVHLDEALGRQPGGDPPTQGEANLVVLQADGQTFGLVVESILDTEEIVVKPLSRQLGGLPTFAGAAIMGDGQVALILDVLGLARTAGILGDHRRAERPPTVSNTLQRADETTWLLASLDSGRTLAIDLGAVARLEELDRAMIERAAGHPVVQYRGGIMPLIWLDALLEPGSADPRRDDPGLQVVVVRDSGGRQAGLVVDRILDICAEPVAALTPVAARGLRGAVRMQGRITDVIDVDAMVGAHALAANGPGGEA